MELCLLVLILSEEIGCFIVIMFSRVLNRLGEFSGSLGILLLARNLDNLLVHGNLLGSSVLVGVDNVKHVAVPLLLMFLGFQLEQSSFQPGS